MTPPRLEGAEGGQAEPAARAKPAINPWLKLALEIGPLAIFFVVNGRAGIFWATGAFMVALVVSLAVTYALARRLPTLPLVTGVFVLFFGGLTLLLQDDLFIKLKPTIVNALFGLILLGGLMAGKSFLKSLLEESFPMRDEGWRVLTFRWGIFFLALACLNEVVWRNLSTDGWVNFKVFAIMPLTILFSLTQLPTMMRYRLEDEDEDEGDTAA